MPLRYKGESALLWFQNLHRYTLYGALFLLICLWWEGFAAFFRGGKFGIGLVWVAFTDFYIYLVATGTIRDLNTW